MRRRPFSVLVCLIFLLLYVAAAAQSGQDTIDVIISPPEWRRAAFRPTIRSRTGGVAGGGHPTASRNRRPVEASGHSPNLS